MSHQLYTCRMATTDVNMKLSILAKDSKAPCGLYSDASRVRLYCTRLVSSIKGKEKRHFDCILKSLFAPTKMQLWHNMANSKRTKGILLDNVSM